MDTFDWRQPLVEYNLWWKMTFKGELLLEKFWESALSHTAIAVIFKEDHPWNFVNHSNFDFIKKNWLCVNRTALWASSSYSRVSLESFFQPNLMRFPINLILDLKCLSHSDPTWILNTSLDLMRARGNKQNSSLFLYPGSDLMRAQVGYEIRYLLDLTNQMFQQDSSRKCSAW